MAGRFKLRKFNEINLQDDFFHELQNDYPEFNEWFKKRAELGSTALVFEDELGLGAFISLKQECEEIKLSDRILPSIPRVKIRTLRIAERYRGQRIGEGALGLALWKWQEVEAQEIYVTVFKKHNSLIELLERFGFKLEGYNYNDECIYIKSRHNINYDDAYKSFPYINPNFENAGYVIIDDHYHDTLFPYSELKNTLQEQVAISAANGISKVYIGSPTSYPPYSVGEPVLIYRRFTGVGQKGFRSCITSYCIVTDVIIAKHKNKYLMSLEKLLDRVSNKSVFNIDDIEKKYHNEKNLVVIELLYYGYFGSGNNVNWIWLNENGFWPTGYPTTARLTKEQFELILLKGNVNVSNVIID